MTFDSLDRDPLKISLGEIFCETYDGAQNEFLLRLHVPVFSCHDDVLSKECPRYAPADMDPLPPRRGLEKPNTAGPHYLWDRGTSTYVASLG